MNFIYGLYTRYAYSVNIIFHFFYLVYLYFDCFYHRRADVEFSVCSVM